ncbi:MAG: NADH-quinone oxidoreductase subunit NuoG [Anaerolineales bacterium]|nr:NADH-quinone oxidoreductase subunit NuoG [Anaerolineales bacterium]
MTGARVRLTIDGTPVEVPVGSLLVDAAKQAGVDVPVFCYHPKMAPVGMCRVCLVEIGRPQRDRATGELVRDSDGQPELSFSGKLETACTTPVEEGWVVHAASSLAIEGRRQIVEYLLTSHPLDCPVCDKGGECPLQNLTMAHGPGNSRFLLDDKIRLDKHVPLGELIFLDRERCIQCARCVRFQEELVDDPVIGFFERGRKLEIVTFSEPGFDSYFSGNTTDICPVGALTTADFRFGARPWELKAAASICPHCPVGCNLMINSRREAKSGGALVVKRVMPRQNESVNETWICDKGRFGYAFADSPERLTRPMIRKDGTLVKTTWDDALAAVAAGLRSAGKDLLGIAGGRASNEDLFNFRSLVDRLEGQSVLDESMPGGEWTGLGPDSDVGRLGPGDAVVVAACDLHEEAPIWWLRLKQAAERGATLIIVNLRPTRLDKHAAHSLQHALGEAGEVVRALQDPGLAADGSRLQLAAQALALAENVIVFCGREGQTRAECQALLGAWARWLVRSGRSGKTNNGLVAVWPRSNTQGAWDLGLRPAPEGLQPALRDKRFAYVMACDPVGDDPKLAPAFRQLDFVVVQELFLTATASLADVVLPAQSFLEREGSLTSGERRAQRFYPVVPPTGDTRPDWLMVANVGEALGVPLERRSAAAVMMAIGAALPDFAGVTYQAMAQSAEQWPPVGGADLYFGGTAYKNRQGLGVLLPRRLAAEHLPGDSPAPLSPGSQARGLTLVPIARLYDQGTTLRPSTLLQGRMATPSLELNPEDAARLGLSDGATLGLAWEGGTEEIPVRVSAAVPLGLALVPRSVGLKLDEPIAANLPQAEARV